MVNSNQTKANMKSTCIDCIRMFVQNTKEASNYRKSCGAHASITVTYSICPQIYLWVPLYVYVSDELVWVWLRAHQNFNSDNDFFFPFFILLLPITATTTFWRNFQVVLWQRQSVSIAFSISFQRFQFDHGLIQVNNNLNTLHKKILHIFIYTEKGNLLLVDLSSFLPPFITSILSIWSPSSVDKIFFPKKKEKCWIR